MAPESRAKICDFWSSLSCHSGMNVKWKLSGSATPSDLARTRMIFVSGSRSSISCFCLMPS